MHTSLNEKVPRQLPSRSEVLFFAGSESMMIVRPARAAAVSSSILNHLMGSVQCSTATTQALALPMSESDWHVASSDSRSDSEFGFSRTMTGPSPAAADDSDTPAQTDDSGMPCTSVPWFHSDSDTKHPSFRVPPPCRGVVGGAGRDSVGCSPMLLISSSHEKLSREALGFIAVCFSCDELINSISLSGLHPTPPRLSRPA